MTKTKTTKEIVNTSSSLTELAKDNLEKLQKINKINADYIENKSKKKNLSEKEIETLDKISSTYIKNVVLLGKLEQELIAREEEKINNEKRKEGNKLEIKLVI